MSNVGKNLEPTKLTIEPGEGAQNTEAPKPLKFGNVNTKESTDAHLNSDVDSGQRSQHHTLGKGRNQASPGNHIHDGITSPKIGALKVNTSGNDLVPLEVLTGSKGGNVALANLIALLGKYFNFTDSTT